MICRSVITKTNLLLYSFSYDFLNSHENILFYIDSPTIMQSMQPLSDFSVHGLSPPVFDNMFCFLHSYFTLHPCSTSGVCSKYGSLWLASWSTCLSLMLHMLQSNGYLLKCSMKRQRGKYNASEWGLQSDNYVCVKSNADKPVCFMR